MEQNQTPGNIEQESLAKKKSNVKVISLLLIPLVITAAVGYAVYVWQQQEVAQLNTKIVELEESIASQNQSLNQSTVEQSSESEISMFEGGGITFEYPSDWVVSERPTESNAEIYTVSVSPRVSYAEATENEANKEEYKDELALHITSLNEEYYQGFANDNQFTVGDNKSLLGDIAIDNKELKLVGHMSGEAIGKVSIAECKTADSCNLYSNFDNEKYATISVGSIVQSRFHTTSIDVESDEYKKLIDIAASVTL